MQLHRRLIVRGLTLLPAGLLVAAPLMGCGGTTVFQGQTGMAVVGELPPAPPPPAPPPPPPPPEPPKRVVLKKDKIEITEKIQFEFNKAVIKEVSFDLLNEIVGVVQKNPHVLKIRIEGHASSEGPDQYNMQLSDRRAKAVMKFLVDKGVADTRLTAQGFGETKPIADNETEEGKIKNRRVEFNIVSQNIKGSKTLKKGGK